ncbi:hypothetical protein ABEU98_20205 [Priestia megaterium]|nr:hypothetical protein [Priestia megaterium]MED4034773.1 hypothetical protein [Priestia megaterium]
MELAFSLTNLAMRGLLSVIFYVPEAFSFATRKISGNSKKVPS